MNRNPTLPKSTQKFFQYWIDIDSFKKRFGINYLRYIDEIHLSVSILNMVVDLHGVEPVIMQAVAREQDAEIIYRMAKLDEYSEEDVSYDDKMGVCTFRKREKGVSAISDWYAEILFDTTENWAWEEDAKAVLWKPWTWLRPLLYKPRLARISLHETIHAWGIGHTRPGRFSCIMDEKMDPSNSMVISEYTEAVICKAHGFPHSWAHLI